MAKLENFDASQQRLANLAKSLAHPARIAILQQLFEDKGCRSTELDLPLARPSIAQHLESLAEVGLISGTFTGRKLCYCLNREAVRQLSSELHRFFGTLEQSTPSSCDPGCC